ncbi:hypothetical protein CERSUDRAFT_88070 [Gelatoporia subvermispora B]|uniref:Uncharacterized protein n=1 Tax=Ceriporiopsis subvermispora (strain B) TaxID=914234 RepID=M2QK19_CERS8|nr:hypothetical protein CERSUDRAFT_88070 [Gelatoporia subvermispora B]
MFTNDKLLLLVGMGPTQRLDDIGMSAQWCMGNQRFQHILSRIFMTKNSNRYQSSVPFTVPLITRYIGIRLPSPTSSDQLQFRVSKETQLVSVKHSLFTRPSQYGDQERPIE